MAIAIAIAMAMAMLVRACHTTPKICAVFSCNTVDYVWEQWRDSCKRLQHIYSVLAGRSF